MDEFVMVRQVRAAVFAPATAAGQRAAALGVLMAALCCAPLAMAGGDLPDPTKPAAAVTQNVDSQESTGGLQLQSVLISPRRKLAVINGQTLHVGEKLGNAVLVKISEHEVVLKSGSETQVLKLFPDVEKRKSSAGKAASHSVKDR